MWLIPAIRKKKSRNAIEFVFQLLRGTTLDFLRERERERKMWWHDHNEWFRSKWTLLIITLKYDVDDSFLFLKIFRRKLCIHQVLYFITWGFYKVGTKNDFKKKPVSTFFHLHLVLCITTHNTSHFGLQFTDVVSSITH